MCVHASSGVWVWNHDGWPGEEQRAWHGVHGHSVHLHPSPVNAAAAALRLWDTLLMSQWILGDLSCGVTEFRPWQNALHASILFFLLAFVSIPLLPPFMAFCFFRLHSHFLDLALTRQKSCCKMSYLQWPPHVSSKYSSIHQHGAIMLMTELMRVHAHLMS